MLDKAVQIAVNAHSGQVDKAGKPYILHLLRVMLKGTSDDEMICGVLHDLIEDTNFTLEYLENEGFSPTIIKALDALAKRPNETYHDFIRRVTQSQLAVRVKINDLEDNMDVSRLTTVTQEDIERVNKYRESYYFLKAHRVVKPLG